MMILLLFQDNIDESAPADHPIPVAISKLKLIQFSSSSLMQMNSYDLQFLQLDTIKSFMKFKYFNLN